MDTWIIADSDSVAARIADSLRRLGVDCPATRAIKADSIGSDPLQIAASAEMVFIGLHQLDRSQIELLQRVRAAVGSNAKLAVIVSDENPASVLAAIRAGASDILDPGDSLDDEIGNFLARMQFERRHEVKRTHVVTIVPCNAPSDANVLAASVAAVIASKTKLCGVLDFHFRGSDLAILLKLTPRHTIVDLFRQTDTIDETMFRQAISTHDSGIQLLAGPMSIGDANDVGVQQCQQVIRLAQRCWPVIVVNAEDLHHAEQVRALAASDQVVLTMRLDVASLRRTQKYVEFLTQCQVACEHIHIVAMATGHAGELPLAAIKKVLQVNHIHCIPDDPVATLMSVNVGNPLVLESPNSKSTAAIRRFAESLAHVAGGTMQPGAPSTAPMKTAARLALNSLRLSDYQRPISIAGKENVHV